MTERPDSGPTDAWSGATYAPGPSEAIARIGGYTPLPMLLTRGYNNNHGIQPNSLDACTACGGDVAETLTRYSFVLSVNGPERFLQRDPRGCTRMSPVNQMHLRAPATLDNKKRQPPTQQNKH